MSFQLTQKDYDKLKAELKNLYELDKLNIIAIKDAKDTPTYDRYILNVILALPWTLPNHKEQDLSCAECVR